MTKSQVKDSLNKKLDKLVNMLGELKYSIIEHPVIMDLYEVDNIITKKLITNAIRSNDFVWFNCGTDTYMELAEDYEDYEFDELVDELDDDLFSEKSTWINLKTILDESSDYEDSYVEDYFDIRLIQYGVLASQKIPKINLYDYDVISALEGFIDNVLLTNEEHNYLKNMDVLLSNKKFLL